MEARLHRALEEVPRGGGKRRGSESLVTDKASESLVTSSESLEGRRSC